MAGVIAIFIVDDVIPHGQMFLPVFYHLADVVAIFIVEVSMTLHYMF